MLVCQISDGDVYLWRLTGVLPIHSSLRHPSILAMKEVLENNPRVSYYSFLMALAKHEGISQDIGEAC